MSLEVFLLMLVLIGVILAFGFRLLIALADARLLTEARDQLAQDNAALTIKVGALERENESWRDGDRIRRRAVHPTPTFPED